MEPSRDATAMRRRSIRLPSTSRFFGVEIGYIEAGDMAAPAIVLLHGIGSNATGFRFVMPLLARRFRVVAWDAPGCGRSAELRDETPAVADYPDVLAGLLDALGIARCHLAGSSFGSLVAIHFAARHPDRVATLCLLAPTTGLGGQPPEAGAAMVKKRLDDLVALGVEGLAAQRAPLLLGPNPSAEARAAAAELLRSIRARGYGQAARFVARADALKAAAHVKAPTLVVCGDQDRVTPLAANAQVLQAAIPGAELAVFPGIGHFVKLEAPTALAERMVRFIERSGGEGES